MHIVNSQLTETRQLWTFTLAARHTDSALRRVCRVNDDSCQCNIGNREYAYLNHTGGRSGSA